MLLILYKLIVGLFRNILTAFNYNLNLYNFKITKQIQFNKIKY